MDTTVIGITGGIGSGKSAVSGIFADCGATVIDADHLAHEVLGRQSVIKALVDRFGTDILNENDQIHREKLAEMVFLDDQTPLAHLESIVHPPVDRQIRLLLEEAREHKTPCVVLDVPLLVDTPWRKECDQVLFIQTTLETRRNRASARGWSLEDLERREARQKSLKEKSEIADIVIDNDGDLESLKARVREVHTQLTEARVGDPDG